jgi:hypothetical protein
LDSRASRANVFAFGGAELRQNVDGVPSASGSSSSKMPSATGKSTGADLYREFEQAGFSQAPIPGVAPNELDLPEEN